jgi:hypothetical protein
MKKVAFLAAAVVALALAGTATAGCWATVGLSSLPKQGLKAGEPWVVTVRVLQHGRTPLANAKPEIRIRNASGELTAFRGRKTARVGSYRFRVSFPTPGRWTYVVYDGFVPHCASEHTFKPITILPAGV